MEDQEGTTSKSDPQVRAEKENSSKPDSEDESDDNHKQESSRIAETEMKEVAEVIVSNEDRNEALTAEVSPKHSDSVEDIHESPTARVNQNHIDSDSSTTTEIVKTSKSVSAKAKSNLKKNNISSSQLNKSNTSCQASSPVKSPRKSETSSDSDKSPASSPVKNNSHPGDRPKKPVVNPFAPKPKSETTSTGKSYNPGKTNYHPIDDAIWARGER